MAIAVGCSQCGRRYQIREEFAGRSVPCKSCGAKMAVPLAITEYGDGSPVVDDPFDDFFGDSAAGPTPRPRPRPRPRSAKPSRRSRSTSSQGIIIAVAVVGGFAILLFIGLIIYRFGIKGSDDPRDPADGFAVEKVAVPSFPDLPAPRIHRQTGAKIHFVDLANQPGNGSGPGEHMKMRVYLPPGEHADRSLGCVLVAPAGTNLLCGNDMDDDDYHAETLPYVQAGYAVVYYSIDGPLSDLGNATEAEMTSAYKKFKAAKAGVANGRNALEFVLAKMPQVDPQRMFSAGHSSAGTLSLLLAAHESRLKGCIAYAPATDVEKRLEELTDAWDADDVFPGIEDFLERSSPKTHADKISCPVFLFHAVDDSNVPYSRSLSYVQQLKDENKSVSFVSAPSGDHYDAMVERGIPAAINWLKRLPGEQGSPNPTFVPVDNRNPPPSVQPPGSQIPPVASHPEPGLPPATNPPPRITPRQPPLARTPGLVASFQVIRYRGSGDVEAAARRILGQFSTYHLGSVKYDAKRKEISVDVRGNFASTGATKSALQRGGFLIGRTTISTRGN